MALCYDEGNRVSLICPHVSYHHYFNKNRQLCQAVKVKKAQKMRAMDCKGSKEHEKAADMGKGMVSMIKVVICDDDFTVLNEIGTLLDKYRAGQEQEITCTAFHSPVELLTEIEKGLRPDILFLDVIMPGEDGISVAKEVRQYDSSVKIIFLTSSTDYAVESYTVQAYFYQIKPIREDSFFRLMDSAVADCETARKCSLILRCKSGITKIRLTKLEYCEIIGRTLLFHMADGTVLESSGSLDELCEKLAGHHNFLRVHRSFLVNMEYIQNISYKAVMMENSAEIPMPHGKCSEIKRRYLEYAFSKRQVLLS